MLGVGAAITAVALGKGVEKSSELFKKSPLPPWSRPIGAGACVTAIASVFPEVQYGKGFAFFGEILAGNQVAEPVALLSLMVAKVTATALSLGGGLVGGLFAPSLLLGALLGEAVGNTAMDVLGADLVGEPSAYALVGMAAVMAATCRAPLTALALIAELTGREGGRGKGGSFTSTSTSSTSTSTSTSDSHHSYY